MIENQLLNTFFLKKIVSLSDQFTGTVGNCRSPFFVNNNIHHLNKLYGGIDALLDFWVSAQESVPSSVAKTDEGKQIIKKFQDVLTSFHKQLIDSVHYLPSEFQQYGKNYMKEIEELQVNYREAFEEFKTFINAQPHMESKFHNPRTNSALEHILLRLDSLCC